MELNQWLTLPMELRQEIVSWLPNGSLLACALGFGPTTERGGGGPFMQLAPQDKKQRLWLLKGLEAAVGDGDLSGIKYLHRMDRRRITPVALTLALKHSCHYGKSAVSKYLYHNMKARLDPEDTDTMAWMCLDGHLDMVQFLHETNAPYNAEAMMEAARHGHLPVVKYLHSVQAPHDSDAIMNCACFNKHVAVVKYLYEQLHLPIKDNDVSAAQQFYFDQDDNRRELLDYINCQSCR